MGGRGQYAIRVRVPASDLEPGADRALLARLEELFDAAFGGDELSFCDGDGTVGPGYVETWLMVPEPQVGREVAVRVLSEVGLLGGARVTQLVVGRTGDCSEIVLWSEGVRRQSGSGFDADEP